MPLVTVFLVGLGVWAVFREIEGPWWRTEGEVNTGGAVYAGPEGMVIVRSDDPTGSEYTLIRPDGTVLSPNGPRLATPWFILPYNRTGVVVHPRSVKAEHDPRLRRTGEHWSFVPLHRKSPLEIDGGAPFARTPDGPQPDYDKMIRLRGS